MRVISGSARRTILCTPEGNGTRPTTDRIKETLFNMISGDMLECQFLDLFSGSGGIGIEALSRGASFACFVEKDKEALKCIDLNLAKTRLKDKAVVYRGDVLSAITVFESKKYVFDYIFMDPPYNNEIEKNVLLKLKDSSIIHEDTMIIVEASKETNMDYLDEYGFELIRKKEYKTNYHAFIRKITR